MKKVFLHLETKKEIDLKILSSLGGHRELKFEVEFLVDPLLNVPVEERREVAHSFAKARIVDGRSPILNPFPYEVEYEMGRFSGRKAIGVLYDARILRDIYFKVLEQWMKINPLESPHVILTDDLIATPDADGYYHARFALFSFPTIISISGIRYAPARSREYYFALMTKMAFGKNSPMEDEFPSEQLPDMILGCLLQAIFFFYTGDPFCENKNCRLFNAHWLKDMIESQIISGKLCEKHKRIAEDL